MRTGGPHGKVRPWQIIARDIMGPKPRTITHGNEYALIFQDLFTKAVHNFSTFDFSVCNNFKSLKMTKKWSSRKDGAVE